MEKATEVVYEYYKGAFALKRRKGAFEADRSGVLLGYKSDGEFLG